MAHKQQRSSAGAATRRPGNMFLRLDSCLHRMAELLPPAGLPEVDFCELWNQEFGTPLRHADYQVSSLEELIRSYGYKHLRIVTVPPGAGVRTGTTCIIPKPTKEQLERAFRRTQAQLHERGFSVTVGAVDRAMAQAFGVRDLKELGCSPSDLQPVKDLLFLEQSSHMYIITYLKARSVCTLADLEFYICQQVSSSDNTVESFNELGIGPLLKFDLVKANFRPPAHVVEVPQVFAVDVIEAIADSMSRNWNYQKKSDTKERKERIDWATVKQKLADKHEAPFEDLCVRLPHSMGPIIIGLVSQWKDENSRLRPAVKTKISRQKAALDNALQKAQEELRVIGKRLIEPHAAGIKQQMAAGLAGLRQKAESALQELLHDETQLLQSQLVLQPLTFKQLQLALAALLPLDGGSSGAVGMRNHSTGVTASDSGAAGSVASAAKIKGLLLKDGRLVTGPRQMHVLLARHHAEQQDRKQQGYTDLALANGLFGQVMSTSDILGSAPPPLDLLSLGDLKITALKKLFGGDVEQLVAVLQPLLPPQWVRQLCGVPQAEAWPTAPPPPLPFGVAPPAALPGPPPSLALPAPGLTPVAADSRGCANSTTTHTASQDTAQAVSNEHHASLNMLVNASAFRVTSQLVPRAVALDGTASGSSTAHAGQAGGDSATADESLVPNPDALSEMLWALLDLLYEQMHPEGNRPGSQQDDSDSEQQEEGYRWWRQAPVAVFGDSTEQAAEQLSLVAVAAETLVQQIAGREVKDPRILDVLSRYWRDDGLLQMLLHAVRVLLQHGPAVAAGKHEPQDNDEAATAADRAEQQEPAEGVQTVRIVGLPELLTAVQELGRLEQDLLKRLEVESLDCVQLPAGCSSLLSMLAKHDELAAALSGHEDSLDIGPVLYDDVMSVVRQAVEHLQHSMRASRSLTPHGFDRAVAAAVCSHFQVPNVLQLGYGPVETLIAAAKEQGAAMTGAGTAEGPSSDSCSSCSVGAWAALAFGPSGAAEFVARAPGLKPKHALAALSTAPWMGDLATWTDWTSLYAPSFGPLKGFLAQHSAEQLGFQVLGLPGGRVAKLPPVSAGLDLQQLRAGWQDAVVQADPGLLVGLLLSRVASQGGLAAAHDLKMLGDILGSIMSASMSQQAAGPAITSAAGLAGTATDSSQQGMTADTAVKLLHAYSPASQRLLHLVLESLQLLPVPLAPVLASEVLLRPLADALRQDLDTVHRSLLATAVLQSAQGGSSHYGSSYGHKGAYSSRPAASRPYVQGAAVPGARQRLHVLGFSLGIAEWQDDCKQQQLQQHSWSSDSHQATADTPYPAASGRLVTDQPAQPEQAQKQPQQLPETTAAANTSTLDSVATDEPAVEQTTHNSADTETAVEQAAADIQAEGLAEGGVTLHAAPVARPAAAEAAAEDQAAECSLNNATLAVELDAVTGVINIARTTPAVEAPLLADGGLAEGSFSTAQGLAGTPAVASQQPASAEPAASATPSSPEIRNPCHGLIERIRRLKGVGVVMHGEAAEAFQATQRTLGNAVEKNADDNKYSPDAPCPMLELVTTASAVTVANNELGFSEQDVMSLSDIGESKKKGEAGYTGQKGIGFKSVFRITDTPHIYSNGFRFNYDLATHGKLGYVTPTWQHWLQDELKQALQSSTLLQLTQQYSTASSSKCSDTYPASATSTDVAASANERTQVPRGPDKLAGLSSSVEPGSSSVTHSRLTNNVIDKLLGPSGNLTAMHLPLKPGCDEVCQKVSQLRPTLLLFLRKLRCLMLTDAERGESKLMMRLHEQGNPDVVRLVVKTVRLMVGQQQQQQQQRLCSSDSLQSCLLSTKSSAIGSEGLESLLLGATADRDILQQEESRWLVVSETFCPGEIRRLHYEVHETKVSLAFGIHEQHPSPQDVFAFLPVRRYGLNFMVQGDFVVPSSRQDVDLDDPFNQLLRSKVAGLFASSFAKLTALPTPAGESELFWIDWWLRCVPLPEHMHDFFANLPSEIASHLMTLPCIPTAAEDGSLGPLVLPGQALVCNNPAIRQLVSAEQLARLQGKFFVHPGISVLYESRDLRKLLGVREFDPQEVISLIKDVAVAGELPNNNIAELRQLLVCVFGLLFAPNNQQQQHQQHWTGGTPSHSAAATAAAGISSSSSSIRVLQLLRELRQVPLLPVYGKPGLLVAAHGGALSRDSSSSSSTTAGVSAAVSTVFLPLEVNSIGAAAAKAGTPAQTPSKARRPPTTPSRPPPSPLAATAASNNINSAAATAVAALAACGITQDYLAGLQQSNEGVTGGRESPQDVADGHLLFVDPQLLQLEEPEALAYMLRGLRELGVRELEPLDVVHGYVLPQLTRQANQLQTAALRPADTAVTSAGELPAPAVVVSRAEQQQLMRLLAFPLAAGLLDAELQKEQADAAGPQQQQQQVELSSDEDDEGYLSGSYSSIGAGTPANAAKRNLFSSSPGGSVDRNKRPQSGHKSLLSQLSDVAVVVTSRGTARLATHSSSSSSAITAAAAEGQDSCLYLPKQLGNKIDLLHAFPAYPWALVSPDYANCCGTVSTAQWSMLFAALGVQRFVPIQQRTLELTWQQLLTDSQYTAWKAAAGQTDNSVRYVIQDWHWPAFDQLLAGIAAAEDHSKQQQLKALCGVVNQLWSDMKQQGQLTAKYSIKTVSATPKSASHRPPSGSKASNSQPKAAALSAAAASWRPGSSSLPSTLLLQLQQSSWVLASDGRGHTPSDLFANMKTIQRLFKQQVLYVACEMQRDMLLALGATADTGLEVVLKVLTSWSNDSSHSSCSMQLNGDQPATSSNSTVRSSAADAATDSETASRGFVTTLADMSRIYEHIEAVVGTADLPDGGFKALDAWHQQQQQGKADNADNSTALSKEVLMRMLACRAFSEQALIWLPDVDAVQAAAEAAAKAAAQEHMYDDMGYGYAGGPAAAAAASRSRFSSIVRPSSRPSRPQLIGAAATAAAAKTPAQVPDDIMYDLSVLNDIQDIPMRGHFYKPEQLRFTDDASMLEVTYHSLSSSNSGNGSSSGNGGDTGSDQAGSPAAAAPVLRVAGLYYRRFQRLFVDQLQRFKYNKWIPLVGLRPTFGDYLRVLEAVIAASAGKATPDSFEYKMVMKVLAAWSDAIARGVMNEVTQNRLWEGLSSYTSNKQWQVFPGTDGSWVSLTGGLLVPDDPVLAGLFSDVPGITFLALPHVAHEPPAAAAAAAAGVSRPAASGVTATAVCSNSSSNLEPLLAVLDIRYVSEVVQQAEPLIQPDQPEPARQLSINLAAALPLLQRHIASHLLHQDLEKLDSVLASRLKGFKVLAVEALSRVHLLPVTNSVTASAEGVISRDGSTWVQRQEPRRALYVLGRDGAAVAAVDDELLATPAVTAAVVDHRGVTAEAPVAAGQGEVGDTDAITDPADSATLTSAHDSASADHSSSEQQSPTDSAAVEVEELLTAPDLLYVARPDELVECCSAVAEQFSSYVADLAAEAGCAVDKQGMMQLLDRLLMVQATGGDVSQVMRQPEYSRYPELPESCTLWDIHIPPEPQPEVPEPAPAADDTTHTRADNADDSAADGDDGDTGEEEAGPASAAAMLPASLDLSGLLDGDEPEDLSGISNAIHQRRLEEEAKIKAKMDAAAAARAAAAAAGQVTDTPATAVPATEHISVGPGATAAAAAGAGSAKVRDPLVISSELFPAVLPAAATTAAARAPAAAAAESLQLPSPAAAAASSWTQHSTMLTPVPATLLPTPPAAVTAAGEQPAAELPIEASVDRQDQAAAHSVEPPAALPPGSSVASAAAARQEASSDSPIAAPAVEASPSSAAAVAPASSPVAAAARIIWDVPTFSILRLSQAPPGAGSSSSGSRSNGSKPTARYDDLESRLPAAGPWKLPAAAAAAESYADHSRPLDLQSDSSSSSATAGCLRRPIQRSEADAIAAFNNSGRPNEHQARSATTQGLPSSAIKAATSDSKSASISSSSIGNAGGHPGIKFGSWPEAESAARAAGLMSDRVPVPQQLLTQLTAELPAAPDEPKGAAAVADAAAVGRYGEELVFRYYQQHPDLQQQQQEIDDSGAGGSSSSSEESRNRVVVEWVNEADESGLPYDVVLYEVPLSHITSSSTNSSADIPTSQQQQQQETFTSKTVLAFLEVKASRDARKQLFELSQRELDFAKEQGDKYHILRVTGVGGSASIERLVNPVKLWSEKVIRLCVVL